MNKSVLEQRKPGISSEAKMTKLKSSDFGCIMRRGVLWKLGGHTRQQEKTPNLRWSDSMNQATGVSLRERSRAVENRTLCT